MNNLTDENKHQMIAKVNNILLDKCFVQSDLDLNLSERKIWFYILYCLSNGINLHIDSYDKYNDRGQKIVDESGDPVKVIERVYVRLPKKELQDFLSINYQGMCNYVYNLVEKIRIKLADDNGRLKENLVIAVYEEWDEEKMNSSLDTKKKKHKKNFYIKLNSDYYYILTSFKSFYTSINMNHLLRFNLNTSFNLYLKLCEYKSTGSFRCLENDLKCFLGYGIDSYNRRGYFRFHDFNRTVIERAIKDIATITGTKVNYNFVKTQGDHYLYNFTFEKSLFNLPVSDKEQKKQELSDLYTEFTKLRNAYDDLGSEEKAFDAYKLVKTGYTTENGITYEHASFDDIEKGMFYYLEDLKIDRNPIKMYFSTFLLSRRWETELSNRIKPPANRPVYNDYKWWEEDLD